MSAAISTPRTMDLSLTTDPTGQPPITEVTLPLSVDLPNGDRIQVGHIAMPIYAVPDVPSSGA